MTRAGAPSPAAAAHLCPLCGRGNGCAVAAGASAPCWCVDAVFAIGARERARHAVGPARCICAQCARDPTPAQISAATAPAAR
jgi:hypothetical protein